MSNQMRALHLLQIMRSQTPPVQADDLAVEIGVSKRTIYRDIDKLRSMGAIIDGAAGFGYTLIEDPALPPMMFNHDEIEALVLGLREVISIADPVLAKAAKNALAKIKATLPSRLNSQFDNGILYAKRFQPRAKILVDVAKLREAIRKELQIKMRYAAGNGDETTRSVLPLGIVYLDKALMLMAWCTLRNAYRAFRLDRIQDFNTSAISFRPKRVSMLRDCFVAVSSGTS